MALFAIVPAAGHSRRMGQPKLTMKLGSMTVIETLLQTLDHPAVTETVVVFRRDDQELANAIDGLNLRRVHAEQPAVDPPDMRSSVERAIESLQTRHAPKPIDGWMLIPADSPLLNQPLLESLIAAWNSTERDILIPQHQSRSGHPAFFRWSLTERLKEIPGTEGLNALRTLPHVSVQTIETASTAILTDMDTPEDYQDVLRQTELTARATPER